MSVEEILASIDALPEEQRQIVYDAVADRHRMEEPNGRRPRRKSSASAP